MAAVRGTPAWLGGVNDRTGLALLLEHGILTKNRISELSGLSKPTASLMVSRLEAAGFIHAVGEISGGRGPSAVSYAVRAERVLGVAIDINHQIMQSTIVDANGAEYPVAETTLSTSARERDAVADVRTAVDAACERAGVEPSAVRMVCVGVQGAVNPRTDELSFVDALPGWPRKGIRHHLEEALGYAVYIDNDVNLAAIAERAHGTSVDATSFALLWMSEGLGLAIDIGGSVHRGASGGAGEIGFLPTPRNADNVEATAKNLQELIGAAAVSRIAKVHGVHKRSYQMLFDALATDPRREDIFRDLAPAIAVGVVPILALLDPELVVLGGPIGVAGGTFLAKQVQASIRHSSRWNPEVAATTVVDRPVLRGAAELLLTEVRNALFREVSFASPTAQSTPLPPY